VRKVGDVGFEHDRAAARDANEARTQRKRGGDEALTIVELC
jgi:hypothetical protein